MPEIDHGTGPIQPVNARDLGQAYYKAAMHEQLPQLSISARASALSRCMSFAR